MTRSPWTIAWALIAALNTYIAWMATSGIEAHGIIAGVVIVSLGLTLLQTRTRLLNSNRPLNYPYRD